MDLENQDEKIKIGHKGSTTRSPNKVNFKNNIYFDTAGYNDTEKTTAEIINCYY